ncbi:hypothetical protein [Chondromyces apiculatus]|uniref:PEGA domain-containing protein n=1 Tax=Chondromyces apiculatus DSM 436 TaxID=1192034 RepID=A0A017THP2_9BACT|nr:hypothetical protein [Chondromyces apiculatus]EYF08360.1 Hypothetical protein CAP_4976 [Chondromyces apiculatus DSM 436]
MPARKGALLIKVDAGAVVLVNGTAVGVAPLADPVVVDAGGQVVEAHLDMRHGRVEVGVNPGEARVVTLTLVDPTAPEASPEGAAAGGGGVGLAAGEAAGADAAGSPENEGAATVSEEDEARAARQAKVWRLGTLLLGGGVTLLGLGIGVGMTAAANGASSEAETLRVGDGDPSACYRKATAPCQALGDAVSTRDTFTTLAAVGYGIGIGAAVGTTLLLLLPPRKRPGAGETVRLAPWVDVAGSGIGVQGTF